MDNEELKKKAAEGAEKAKETAGKAKDKAKEFYGKAKESELVKKISEKTKLGANAVMGIAGGIVLVLLVVIIAGVGGGSKSNPKSKTSSVAEDSSQKKTPVNSAAKKVKVPSKANSASDFQYDMTKEGDGVVILDYIGTGTTVVRIPDEIEGYPVVEIAASAFYHTTGVEDPKHEYWYNNRWNTCQKPFDLVYVPRTVTRVGCGAFPTWKTKVDISEDDYLQGVMQVDMDVSKLKSFSDVWRPVLLYSSHGNSMQLKDTDIVISKDFNASFSPDPEHTWYNYKDLNSCFGSGAVFSNGSNITSVKIEEGVKIISDGMFLRCENLKTVTIPASVTEIHKAAFSGCKNLETVNFAPGAKIKYLGLDEGDRVGDNYAFAYCPKLSLKMRQAIKETGYTGSF